ncbi:NTP transferase domain-containing protein [Bacillus sp. CGMCC 1.16607]|uniref:nucleotidyltransferase family protein n=1 Tax=Bacillus sp. CGMCC 1.16607 TaxID=3351842 RepID=UPI00362FFB58
MSQNIKTTYSGIYIIILASGLAKRMGRRKLTLPFQGISIIEHLLKKLEHIFVEGRKIVIPTQDDELMKIVSSFDCQIIYNETPDKGMGHSLSLAIDSLPNTAEAAIILLGDQPKLCMNDILEVCLEFKRRRLENDECPKVIIQMKYSDGPVGHPVLFTKHFFDELKALNGDVGGREIIQRNESFLFFCKSKNEYPKDVDSPDDYRQLLKEEGMN